MKDYILIIDLACISLIITMLNSMIKYKNAFFIYKKNNKVEICGEKEKNLIIADSYYKNTTVNNKDNCLSHSNKLFLK